MHLTRAQNDQLRALANSHVADTPLLARSTSRARTVPSSTYRLEGSNESVLSASRRPGSPDSYPASLSSSRAAASTQAVLSQVDQSVASMRQGAEADLAAYKARLAAKLGSSAPVAVGAPLYSGATSEVPPASPIQGASTTMGMGMGSSMRMSPMSEEEEERDRGSARVKQQGDGPVSLPRPAPVGRAASGAAAGGTGGGYARKGADPASQSAASATGAAAAAGKTSVDLQLGAEPRPEVRAGPVDMDRTGHVLSASGEERQGGTGTGTTGARAAHGQAVTVSSASTATPAAGRSGSAGRGSGVPVGSRTAGGSAGKGGARAPSNGRRPSSTAAPAPAPAPPPAPPSSSTSSSSTPSMSAPQFFSLLRTHVPPSALETLMAGLTLFNKGDISKGELMNIAGTSLGQAYPSSAPHGGAPPDLLAMFKSLILRV